VRVVRQEVNQNKSSFSHFRYYAVDVLHFAFSEEYIRNHLIPFADEFARRVVQMREILLRGGIAPSESWRWSDVRPAPARK
jgi:hypothetical protein